MIETAAVAWSRGHAAQGPTPVTAYHLQSDDISVEVWTHGARLVSVRTVDRRGEAANVVLRYSTLAEYDDWTQPHGYLGATVGRYANRIADSRLEIDGQLHRLHSNEGPHQRHGGPIGFDQHVWYPTDAHDDADGAHLTLTHASVDGDQGFPGRLEAVTYRVIGPTLTIHFQATSDAPTVCGMTNHAYWNLGASSTIADHLLEVHADHYVPIDAALIPDGQIQPVEASVFDLRTPRTMRSVISHGGLDHCLVLTPGEGPSATLTDPTSGRTLRLYTDEPGLQVYTGTYLDPPFAAICLEPERLPNTPNRPEFGSAILRPGERYSTRTRFEFGTC